MALIKTQEFKPTPAMRLYAFQKAKLGEKAKDSAISKKIGIRPETISRWKQINGFDEWLEEQVLNYRAPVLEILEQVALDNLNDFNYWSALAKKNGFFGSPGSNMTNTPALVIDLSGQFYKSEQFKRNSKE